MQNNRRQFYIFDLELCARKAGATVPTMTEILPVLQRMKDTRRTYSLRSNTATMLIGDIAVSAAQQFVTLLVRLSDTTTPNSIYSDPAAGHFNEHVKVGNVGSDFGCHVLISTAPEQGMPNIYTCAIERIPGLPFDLVRRLLSKLLNFEYHDDATFFSYPHPAGGVDANNQPRRDRCCPHVELRGRPSDTLVNDINAGRISGVSLIKAEAATPIGGAPYLTKSESELKLGIDHNNLPINLWASLSQAIQQNAQTYNAAKITYKLPNSSRTTTVEISTANGAILTEMYVLSFELTGIFPFLAQSAMQIVAHLRDLAVPQFLANRTI
ncbi:hypothetical protein [Sphingobium yanoikuyae]|uniref:hypothetical protein n=1 Tax=Sphingobium yanoikuyae TaxID=13690 RepID=UPI0028A83158|nr:hypothetical protein [Sphingobium yanoikuyae]